MCMCVFVCTRATASHCHIETTRILEACSAGGVAAHQVPAARRISGTRRHLASLPSGALCPLCRSARCHLLTGGMQRVGAIGFARPIAATRATHSLRWERASASCRATTVRARFALSESLRSQVRPSRFKIMTGAILNSVRKYYSQTLSFYLPPLYSLSDKFFNQSIRNQYFF